MVSDRAFIFHIYFPWGKTKSRSSARSNIKVTFFEKMAFGALVFHNYSLSLQSNICHQPFTATKFFFTHRLCCYGSSFKKQIVWLVRIFEKVVLIAIKPIETDNAVGPWSFVVNWASVISVTSPRMAPSILMLSFCYFHQYSEQLLYHITIIKSNVTLVRQE